MGLFSKKKAAVKSTLPMLTETLPLVPFKILASKIPFYRDQECTQMVEDARIVILQALDPEDEIQELDIVPSTLTYESGDYVTMSLDNKKLWEDCWFKDPETGEIQKAWQIHVNFIGEVISPQVVERNKQHLQVLEQKVNERIEQIAKSQDSEGPVN